MDSDILGSNKAISSEKLLKIYELFGSDILSLPPESRKCPCCGATGSRPESEKVSLSPPELLTLEEIGEIVSENLAGINFKLLEAKDYSGAYSNLVAYQKAVTEVFGEGSESAIRCYQGFANWHRWVKEFGRALEYRLKMLELLKRHWGETGIMMALTLFWLFDTCREAEYFEQCETYGLKFLEVLELQDDEGKHGLRSYKAKIEKQLGKIRDKNLK